MKTKPLTTALIAAGVLAVGTAGAFSLNPSWLKKADGAPAQPAAASASSDVQMALASPPPAVPMLSATSARCPTTAPSSSSTARPWSA